MSRERIRHRKNAPGPFYVEAGSCLSCMAPHGAAPELMGYDEDEGHCYFRQQPSTKDEVYLAIRALRSSELDCLHYAGDDPDILRRLTEAQLAEVCDQPVPAGAIPLCRNYVTFAPAMNTEEAELVDLPLLEHLASSFRAYFLIGDLVSSRFQATSLEIAGEAVAFACSWSSEQLFLTVSAGEAGTNRVLISHSPVLLSGSIGLSLMLDDWLRTSERLASIKWYTAQSWHSDKHTWQETAI